MRTRDVVPPSEDELFGEVINPYVGPKPGSMRLYDYYSRSAKPEVESLRCWWNWVYRQCRLSKAKKSNLRSQFRSKHDEQHFGALFELFLYEFIHSMRCRLRCEPRLGDKRPDFKVLCPGHSNFYLEATCALCEPKKSDADRWRQRVYDAIHSVESNRFRLLLHFTGRPLGEPNCKKIKLLVRDWLSKLDQELSADPGHYRDSRQRAAECILEEKGLRIELTATTLRTLRSSKPFGLARIGPAGRLQVVITDEYLQRKLAKKEATFKRSRLPNVVAVNLLDSPPGNDTLVKAFGAPTGIWTRGDSSASQYITAVMLFFNVDLHFRPCVQPLMVLNPWAENATELLGLPYLSYLTLSKVGRRLECINPPPKGANRDWPFSWPEELMPPRTK